MTGHAGLGHRLGMARAGLGGPLQYNVLSSEGQGPHTQEGRPGWPERKRNLF